MLVYGYCIGVASSRRIAQRLHEDIAFRVLAANNTPDFRKDHLGAVSGLFVQVLAFCQRAGLVEMGDVALDGTKVRANASRHEAMSYQRMKEKEEQLAAEVAEVAELLRRAQDVDEEEDSRYGQDRRYWMNGAWTTGSIFLPKMLRTWSRPPTCRNGTPNATWCSSTTTSPACALRRCG